MYANIKKPTRRAIHRDFHCTEDGNIRRDRRYTKWQKAHAIPFSSFSTCGPLEAYASGTLSSGGGQARKVEEKE